MMYKGLNWINYCDKESKWLKSIYDVELVNTEYVAQGKCDDDYEKFLAKQSKKYNEPIITLLVKNSRKVVDK